MKLLKLLGLILLFISCSEDTTNKYKFKVACYSSDYTYSIVYCDSLNMKSVSNVTIYVDGTKTEIISHHILVQTNSFYKK